VLQRALINFPDEATAWGYKEIRPPLMVNAASARAPPADKEAMYTVEGRFFLIPTAEVLVNIHRRGSEEQLPHTPLFTVLPARPGRTARMSAASTASTSSIRAAARPPRRPQQPELRADAEHCSRNWFCNRVPRAGDMGFHADEEIRP
jgi:hypothetical protein